MPIKINRRHFLQSAAATAASLPFMLTSPAFGQKTSANEQITLGCIGLGVHGFGWNLAAFLKIPDARVIAVCDTYQDRAAKAQKKINETYGNTDCTIHADFREILARKDIDAVVISTPDHWHVLMSVMAARAGKDVFCEKPTLNIKQGQILIDEMNAANIVYQGGIEDRSVKEYYRMAEVVRNGGIGKLNRVHVLLPGGKIFEKEEEVPVPKGFNYDMWLGPAPYTPFTPTKTDHQQWRNVWDYSGGNLTDWGAHLIDTAQVVMFQEHGGPLEVDGKGEFPENALSQTATEYRIHYRYANDVEMIVKSGGTGIRCEGTDGWIQSPAWRKPLEASDPDILEAVYAPDKTKLWPRPPSEHVDFIQSVQQRRKTTYTPKDIHHLSTAMHLGNISMRLNRPLKWNAKRQKIVRDKEANTYLSTPMRGPWTFDA